MNLQQTVSKIRGRDVSVEEAKTFAHEQFGTLCAFNREWEKEIKNSITLTKKELVNLLDQYSNCPEKSIETNWLDTSKNSIEGWVEETGIF